MFIEWAKNVERRVLQDPEKARRYKRLRGTIPDELTGTDFYKEVEQIRFETRRRFWFGVVLYSIAFYLLFSGHGWWRIPTGLLSFAWGAIYLLLGREAMRAVHREFCRSRIVPYQRQLQVEFPELVIYIPKLKIFLKRKDLRELERWFLEGVRHDVEIIRHQREMKRWPAQNDKLRGKMLQSVRNALLPPATKSRIEEVVLETWEALSENPARRKKYVGRVERFIALETHRIAQQSMLVHTPTVVENEAAINNESEDYRIKILEAEAEDVTSEAALGLRKQALETTDRRARIRLLKQAIRIDRAGETEVVEPQVIEIAAKESSNEARFLILDQVMEESFLVAHLVPKGLDADMVKEILLELLDPGSSQRRFQKAYRPETRLRRRVRQRYECWIQRPFDPRSYQRALDWLVQEGVLRTKPKREQTYSLSANTLEARSEQARELVKAILSLDRTVRSL